MFAPGNLNVHMFLHGCSNRVFRAISSLSRQTLVEHVLLSHMSCCISSRSVFGFSSRCLPNICSSPSSVESCVEVSSYLFVFVVRCACERVFVGVYRTSAFCYVMISLPNRLKTYSCAIPKYICYKLI